MKPARHDVGLAQDEAISPKASLQARYGALCEKYERLVSRFQEDRERRIGTYQLANWALRTTPHGIALIAGDSVAFCNERWRELGGNALQGRTWRAEGASTSARFDSLRELAIQEARTLLGEPGAVMPVRRYQRDDGASTVEVQLQSAEPGYGLTAVAIAADVTDRRRLEQELDLTRNALLRRERLRLAGEVALGIAHDLRNSFLLMRQQLALLDPTQTGAPGAHLVKLLDDCSGLVMRLSETGHSQVEGETTLLDLATLVKEVTPLIDGASIAQGLEIRLDLAADVPAVSGNPVELRRLILNLLLNARETMQSVGRIDLALCRRGDRVLLSVADEGHGIAPAHLARVFEPDFTTRRRPGSGLGLANARAIAHRHGGTLEAMNRPGGGAVFTLSLPVGIRTKEPPKARAHHRILVIDDNPQTLLTMRESLEQEGFEVEAIGSSLEGLALLRGGSTYAAVICPVDAPGASGWTITQAAKTRAPGTRVLLISSAQGAKSDRLALDSRRSSIDELVDRPLVVPRLRTLLD